MTSTDDLTPERLPTIAKAKLLEPQSLVETLINTLHSRASCLPGPMPRYALISGAINFDYEAIPGLNRGPSPVFCSANEPECLFLYNDAGRESLAYLLDMRDPPSYDDFYKPLLSPFSSRLHDLDDVVLWVDFALARIWLIDHRSAAWYKHSSLDHESVALLGRIDVDLEPEDFVWLPQFLPNIMRLNYLVATQLYTVRFKDTQNSSTPPPPDPYGSEVLPLVGHLRGIARQGGGEYYRGSKALWLGTPSGSRNWWQSLMAPTWIPPVVMPTRPLSRISIPDPNDTVEYPQRPGAPS